MRQVPNIQPATEKLWRFPLDLVSQHPDQSRSKPSPWTSRRQTSRSISVGVLESGLCQASRHPVCTSRRTVGKAPQTAGVPTTWTLTAIPLVSYHCLSLNLPDSSSSIIWKRFMTPDSIVFLISILSVIVDRFYSN